MKPILFILVLDLSGVAPWRTHIYTSDWWRSVKVFGGKLQRWLVLSSDTVIFVVDPKHLLSKTHRSGCRTVR